MLGNSHTLGIGGRGSIARQILFPVVLLIITSNIAVISIIMRQLDDQLLLAAEQKLTQISELQSIKFTADIDNLINDIRIVSRTAPIKAILKTGVKESAHSDEGVSVSAWKGQLETIFAEIMHFENRYTQIRLILADGSEWLRVDRYGAEGGIRVVQDAELQNKYNSFYFHAAMGMPEGSVYLSDIELNREYGEISIPKEAVIRASIPLYSNSGDVFGVMVFNQNLQENFEEFQDLAGDDVKIFLANSDGEYVFHPNENKRFQFEYGRSANIVADFPLANALLTEKNDKFKFGRIGSGDDQRIYSLSTIEYSPGNAADRLIVAANYDFSSALKLKSVLLNKIYIFLIVVGVIAFVLAIFVSGSIASPIVRMRNALANLGLETTKDDLPLNSRGEVGDLARVFDNFLSELSRRQKILNAEVVVREEAQAELENNNHKLMLLNQELEQFAYIASHDLQEPLRTVTSFVDLLIEHKPEQQDEQVKVFYAFIQDSTSRMRELVKGLLDYSRLGEGSVAEEIDCQQLIDVVCEDLQVSIDESHADILYSDLPKVIGKRTEIRLLFQNLISNGIKFSRKGISPRVEISAKRGNDEWVFCVRDNGVGIKSEYFSKIFKIFQRLNNRDDFEGAGIGLAHCKKIVEMHKGLIWLESTPGEGSAFYFSLRDGTDE